MWVGQSETCPTTIVVLDEIMPGTLRFAQPVIALSILFFKDLFPLWAHGYCRFFVLLYSEEHTRVSALQ